MLTDNMTSDWISQDDGRQESDVTKNEVRCNTSLNLNGLVGDIIITRVVDRFFVKINSFSD